MGIFGAVCGHVMTAQLCAAQRGGLMNTGELCESTHLDEMFLHTACDLSPFAFSMAILSVLLFPLPHLNQNEHHTWQQIDLWTTGAKAWCWQKLQHHAYIIVPPGFPCLSA